MESALTVHRLHFAFTVTYHYLFPQLTMGLALFIVILKAISLRRKDEEANRLARLLGKLFGITFLMGVVTGIPMEFQFGTNWARFSRFSGGVIGQTLAMEGVFAFFLESTFLGLFLFGERRLGPRGHFVAAALLWIGAWLSGFFIVATNAWMQNPVGYFTAADGSVQLQSFWALIFNEWAWWAYMHTMSGAVITGAFFVASLGAFYVLSHKAVEAGGKLVRIGVITAFIASVLQLFPSGDQQGNLVAHKQPATLAAMEGLFHTRTGAPLALMGQPDVEQRRLDNPLHVPKMLSFLTYRHWEAEVKGLEDFPPADRPDNVPLLYYAYHIMVGLGTMFIAVMLGSVLLLWRGQLLRSRQMLWILMLSVPFPYIANTAGWLTAELGRQPWLVYGLMRTAHGTSHVVSAGNGWFTLLGFMGMYTLLSILYLLLMWHEIQHGPGVLSGAGAPPASEGPSPLAGHEAQPATSQSS